ncbi:MAG: FAD binding domain-containing protein [Deltaproteobacteria bacterium]|nr:FAD binding domain-containing protein [Deltaproteobacteria bacterium]
MRKFTHANAKTLDEAVLLLKRYGGKAAVVAGGTDLIGKMKDEILPSYPEAVINIKTIHGLEFITEKEGELQIGALTRLEDIATNPVVKERFHALSEAAERTASTHLREMGTLGGNICQDIRCWFYRNPGNRFPCLRKGGGRCYALEGDNRYHSIFGGSVLEGCMAVHPSDTAPSLVALDAKVVTNRRTVRAEEFFDVGVCRTTVLEPDEIVTEIRIPEPPEGAKSAFVKFALRESIDFPIVNCAAGITVEDKKVTSARVCLNAVWVKPYRAVKAEKAIIGKAITEETAEAAGAAAVIGAKPLRDNGYMVQIAKTMVKRSILACA